MPKAIILDLFWVVFYEVLPQMRFNLYQIFNSDAMQKTHFLAHSKRFFVCTLLRPLSYALILCHMKDLMKVHSHCKFHQRYLPQRYYFSRQKE